MKQINDFFRYFFGIGTEVEFKHFSIAHLIPILVAAAIIYCIWRFRTPLGNYKHEGKVRMGLAFVAIITEMSYFWRMACHPDLEGNPEEYLPITVCGWAVVFCSYLVVTKSQTLFDIAYFWLFSGTVFGLLTPTVITYCGPTRFRFYQFWLEHTIGYIIIFYMMFVHKMRPTWKSFIKSAAAISILLFIAIFVNEMLGPPANYLFVAGVEDTASVLNLLPKNDVLRVLLMAAIIMVMFFLAYLPWFLKDRKAKKQQALQDTAD